MKRIFPKDIHKTSLDKIMGKYCTGAGCSGIAFLSCDGDMPENSCRNCILDFEHRISRHDLLALLAEHKVFNEGEILAAMLDYSTK